MLLPSHAPAPSYQIFSHFLWYKKCRSGHNGEPLVETDNSGNALNEYVYFNGSRIARRAISGGLVHYTFNDLLNSATVIADNTGAIQKQYDYAPYGEIHWQSGTDPNHYQFSGKELDTETGDSYFGARYYRSNMGRFITPDWSATPGPLPYAGIAEPQTLNLYSYTQNNPVSKKDINGHCSAPTGLLSGQVGLCVETFIGAKTIHGLGRGDNRGPVGNDKNATFRTDESFIIDLLSHQAQRSAPAKAGVSKTIIGISREGSVESDMKQSYDSSKGELTLTIRATGLNGLWFLPGVSGEIEHAINITFDKNGKVVALNGIRKAYPSLEIWTYDSKGNPHLVRYVPEQDPDDLNYP
jgi:RHS repeat-associated protein